MGSLLAIHPDGSGVIDAELEGWEVGALHRKEA